MKVARPKTLFNGLGLVQANAKSLSDTGVTDVADTLECIEGTFTYTYDLFTVFFYGDHVFVGGKEYPIGQCCVDIMNLDETVLSEIEQRVRALIPVARTLLIEKQTALQLSHRRD